MKLTITRKMSIQRISQIILFNILVLFLFRDILYYTEIIEIPSTTALSWRILVTVIVEFLLLFFNDKVYKLGFSFIIYTYTMLTHFGFAIAMIFDQSIIRLKSEASMAFYYNPDMNIALLISSIVIEVFTIFILFFSNKRKIYKKDSNAVNHSIQKNAQTIKQWSLYFVITMQVFILIYLVYIIITNNLLGMAYGTRWYVMNSLSAYGHTIVLYALTFAFVLLTGDKTSIRCSLFIYSVTAIVHFILGNRGEVLYSAIVCFSIYYLRTKKVKKSWLIWGVAIVLIIPVIRYVREFNFEGTSNSFFYMVLETVAELGWQISPFTSLISYLENGGVHTYGGTYLFHFYDFIARKMPFLPQVTSSFTPFRITDIMPYTGMGFTMIGEIFYNFGLIGSCVCYGIFARFLTRAEEKIWMDIGTGKSQVLSSLLTIEFVNLTRNSSSTLPLYLSYILILYLLFTPMKRIRKHQVKEKVPFN